MLALAVPIFLCGNIFAQTAESETDTTVSQRKKLMVADSTIVVQQEPDTITIVTDTAAIAEPASVVLKQKRHEKTDTVSVVKVRHSPAKAAMYSGVLPGLGQAYNKKYWKIPIVYAGFAGLGYWISYNSRNYRDFRDAYRIRLDDDPNTIDRYDGQYSNNDLKTLKDFHKRNLDLSCILTAVWYAIGIIDATVDAHLFEFDISDNLSMKVQPVFDYQSRQTNFAGLRVQLKL